MNDINGGNAGGARNQDNGSSGRCSNCNHDPCLWNVHGHEILRSGRQHGANSNAGYRHFAYTQATRMIHGVLGYRNRRKLPDCIVNNIREQWPDDAFVGFREASD